VTLDRVTVKTATTMDHDIEVQVIYYVQRRRRLAALITLIVAQLAIYWQILFSSNTPIPFHTSILTGEGWMLELLNGHPERIRISLGVSHDAFDGLLQLLVQHGVVPSRNGISVEEQLGIFLYTCVTGLSSRHVTERFQHSPGTITRSVESLNNIYVYVTFF
jgi:hypothetical protein